jgi:ABC-type branched-subunit amino acid transport system substrate-binding protein
VKRKHIAVLAMAATVALTAGACAKVGDQQGASGDSSVGITDNSIKLGTSMGLTGKTGGEATAAMQGAQSYFMRTNDEGGVNGRKIDFEALDDGFNASQTAANVRKLVEQDKVFALFYLWGVNQTLAALPYIEANNVILFGPQAPVRKLVDPVKKSVFLISPTFYEQGQVDARFLITSGAKKLGVLYENDPVGQEALSGVEAEVQRQGATVVRKTSFTTGTPSFTGPIVDMKSAGVDGLIIFGTNPDVVSIARDLGRQDWHPKLASLQNSVDPTFLALSGDALDGLVAPLPSQLPTGNEPDVVAYRTDLAKYFPGGKVTTFGLLGYGEAKLFVQALKNAGKSLTKDSLIAALEKFKAVPTGVLAPVSFTPQNHAGADSYVIVQVHNSKPALVTDWQSFSK